MRFAITRNCIVIQYTIWRGKHFKYIPHKRKWRSWLLLFITTNKNIRFLSRDILFLVWPSFHSNSNFSMKFLFSCYYFYGNIFRIKNKKNPKILKSFWFCVSSVSGKSLLILFLLIDFYCISIILGIFDIKSTYVENLVFFYLF